MCKKVLCVCTPIVLCILLIFTSCLSKNDTDEFWGSYTYKKTYSYDHKLYAVQTVEDSMIVVTVYKTKKSEILFLPALLIFGVFAGKGIHIISGLNPPILGIIAINMWTVNGFATE